MSNGFQTQVGTTPAFGIPGNFASANPHFSVDFGPGGAVAGPQGCVVGRFAWASSPAGGDGAPSAINNFGAGAPTGFVAAEQQGLNTIYLADASMLIPAGFGMGLFSGTDFWVKNDDPSVQALPGGTVYAELATGKIRTAAATGSATGSIAAGTASFTAGIAGDIMTVTAVASGTIYPGALITSGAASGTVVGAQISGTTGGVGVYSVSIPEQTVAAGTSFTTTHGVFTAASALSGSFGLGSVLSGSGVSSGTKITAFGTGNGGLGTYIVDLTQTAGSTTITGTLTVATKWKFASSALPGEVCKMTSQPLG